MRLPGIVALCFSLQSAWGQDQSVRLWAVSQNVRVNPVTGTLMEARPDIHQDYPSEDYRRGNLVWDAQRKTVSLKAARNEFVAFQLIIESDAALKGVDVSLAELRHDSGATIEGKHLALFQEWCIRVRKPSTGYEATSLGAGWYPYAFILSVTAAARRLGFRRPVSRPGR